MFSLLFGLLLLLLVVINGQTTTVPPVIPTVPVVTSTTPNPNPINNMDFRVRRLEGHFYPEPNAISYLEEYYNNFGESILDLDLALRLLLNGNTEGNDFRDAEEKYKSNIPPNTRNGYNILEMDEEIFKLQKRIQILEDEVDALEDNDYDSILLKLVFQIQCELSQIKDGEPKDCRVSTCSADVKNELKKMIDDLSPVDGQCPAGYTERKNNGVANYQGAKSLIGSNALDNNNNDNNNYTINDYNYLQSQLYTLYSIIGFLFGLNLIGCCLVVYHKKQNNFNVEKYTNYPQDNNQEEVQIINNE